MQFDIQYNQFALVSIDTSRDVDWTAKRERPKKWQ